MASDSRLLADGGHMKVVEHHSAEGSCRSNTFRAAGRAHKPKPSVSLMTYITFSVPFSEALPPHRLSPSLPATFNPLTARPLLLSDSPRLK